MKYLITGATGFIGRRFVKKLLARADAEVYAVVREQSREKWDAMQSCFDHAGNRLHAVSGDLVDPGLGLSDEDRAALAAIDHVVHLGAIYDLVANADDQITANVDGTRHALDAAVLLKAGCFHHVSSVAVAGRYDGIFREDMFHEAAGLDHAYFRSKHDAEALVRDQSAIPYRIYRPSVVVGDSRTGEMDKVDGPYYLFKFIQKVRRALPPWMPAIGIEGGRWNVVPVNFVVDALDALVHQPGRDGGCFHLTDPNPLRIGELIDVFARAAHAPPLVMRINTRMFGFIPPYVLKGIVGLPPIRRAINVILKDLGLPRELFGFINYPTRFDCRETLAALEGTGIECPPLDTYATALWDYWERNLDPDLFRDRSLSGRVRDRVVVVTGGSSGIGKATATMMAQAGAKVAIVARDPEKLADTRKEIAAMGHEVHTYSVDLTDFDACDAFVEQVQVDLGDVAVLVNNAGRSIRRSIMASYDRFHDFERTMKLNYFSCLRLALGFLPSMQKNHQGHVVNISSIGVLTNAPRFSAYVASKAALDAFARCAAAEFSGEGIHFTTINMPLVRTPMIAPTKMYAKVPAISPEEAAGMVAQAVIGRPKRIATRLGIFMSIIYAIAPKVTEVLMNTAYRLFPDSSAAKGQEDGEAQKEVSPEQAAFAEIMRGIHW